MDILEQHSEPFNQTWLASRLDHNEKIGSRGNWPGAEAQLRYLWIDGDRELSEADPHCWEIQIGLAWNLYYQHRFDESERVAQGGIDLTQRYGWAVSLWGIRALHILSSAQHAQAKHEAAQINCERQIEMAGTVYGERDPRTIRYSLKLESWLRIWRRDHEADVITRERAELLGPPEIEELSDTCSS